MYHLLAWSNLNFLHISQWIPLPTQSCLALYCFCANLLHLIIMWLMVLSLHSLHLLFCCVLSILALIWLVLMALLCATIRRDSVSLLNFPFLSHVLVLSCKMLFISLLKQPWSCFPSHFCFLVICHSVIYRVVSVVSDGRNKSSFVFFYVVFESLLLLLLLVVVVVVVVIVVVVVVVFTPLELFSSSLADYHYWSLRNSKSSQVSKTLLNILAVINNVVVWMVPTHLPTSKSSSSFHNPLFTVIKAPITIGIIVIFMFHFFFYYLARAR